MASLVMLATADLESPARIVFDALWDTVTMILSWFHLTPLGLIELVGALLVVVVVWQLVQAKRGGGRWHFQREESDAGE